MYRYSRARGHVEIEKCTTTAHSVELGFGFLSQDWQLYGRTNSLCEIHSQFCHFAPQVQNEFPVQTPSSQNGRIDVAGCTHFAATVRQVKHTGRRSIGGPSTIHVFEYIGRSAADQNQNQKFTRMTRYYRTLLKFGFLLPGGVMASITGGIVI